jgi:hypothetical protein
MADRVVTLYDGMICDDTDIAPPSPDGKPAIPPILDLQG